MSKINLKRINAATTKWRNENAHLYAGGVVVTFLGEVTGWMNELRDPQGWRPGCIATDADGQHYRAVGGNEYDGAERWEAVEA